MRNELMRDHSGINIYKKTLQVRGEAVRFQMESLVPTFPKIIKVERV
jgi:hypothetical protein